MPAMIIFLAVTSVVTASRRNISRLRLTTIHAKSVSLGKLRPNEVKRNLVLWYKEIVLIAKSHVLGRIFFPF